MDEQLKAVLEGINALKSGQEETKERMENMQRSQEETKNELKEGMQKGQERMQKCHEDLKNALEKKIDNVEEKINSVVEKIALKVEEKIAVVEEKIEKKVEQVEERIREQNDERIEKVAGNFSQRVEDLEKKLPACEKMKENKFVPTSSVPVPASPVSVKLSTYDGKTNWELYKTQFSIISEANGWTEGVKACQLAASLRGEAAEILQTLPETERLNLNSLYNALNLRFSQKYSKDYARIQMKTRLQQLEPSDLLADAVRSRKEEMPSLLRFDWSKPIDAESGRGNGLGRSENKRPETRSWN
ncbi:uncharacterized protein TNCV_1497761 [Trichonephila clavipes]|nr:uncharacterized protein TNCV_1497761 [Trichonephila clavipes]